MAAEAANTRVIQRPSIHPEVVEYTRILSTQDDACSLGQIYDYAIDWFIKSRQGHTFNYYCASTRRCRYRSMWIDRNVLNRAKILAARDDVSVSRVIATALTLFTAEGHTVEPLAGG